MLDGITRGAHCGSGGRTSLLDRTAAAAIAGERREAREEEQCEEQANAPHHHEDCPHDLDIKPLQRGFYCPDKNCADGDEDEAEADATTSHSNQLSLRRRALPRLKNPCRDGLGVNAGCWVLVRICIIHPAVCPKLAEQLGRSLGNANLAQPASATFRQTGRRTMREIPLVAGHSNVTPTEFDKT